MFYYHGFFYDIAKHLNNFVYLDRAPTSWYQAVKHCAKISTTLVNKFERGSNVPNKWWMHSLQYNEYALNEGK